MEVLVESVPAFGADLDLDSIGGVFVEVTEVHGPFVGPFGRGEEFVDEDGAAVGVETLDEGVDAGGFGDATGEIESDTANEFVVGGFAGGGDVVGLQVLQDVLVDEIAVSGCSLFKGGGTGLEGVGGAGRKELAGEAVGNGFAVEAGEEAFAFVAEERAVHIFESLVKDFGLIPLRFG